jgi:hypothetical protein
VSEDGLGDESGWYPFDGGRTIGAAGSESGVIVADDEHGDGARITLERDAGVAPFAITCGIYGWMMHTRWFGDEAQARRDYDAMKHALGAIANAIPLKSDPDADARMGAVTRAIGEFVDRFP